MFVICTIISGFYGEDYRKIPATQLWNNLRIWGATKAARRDNSTTRIQITT